MTLLVYDGGRLSPPPLTNLEVDRAHRRRAAAGGPGEHAKRVAAPGKHPAAGPTASEPERVAAREHVAKAREQAVLLETRLGMSGAAIANMQQLWERIGKGPEAAIRAMDQLRKHAEDTRKGVEADLYQVKNQSGQDPLNFPIKTNNRLASLLGMTLRGEGKPTANIYPIFEDLKKELQQTRGI